MPISLTLSCFTSIFHALLYTGIPRTSVDQQKPQTAPCGLLKGPCVYSKAWISLNRNLSLTIVLEHRRLSKLKQDRPTKAFKILSLWDCSEELKFDKTCIGKVANCRISNTADEETKYR